MSTNVHILVVEGSRTQAERLKLVLQAHTYQVTVVTDGGEAIAVARTQRPALIISGIAMSGMDGYDMCAALKQDDALKDIPVVLLTALSDAEDLIRGLGAKVDYVISKPYQEDDLLARIAAILAGPVQHTGELDQEQLAVTLRGKHHVITSNRQQLLRLLLSTYENYSAVLRHNRELTTAQMQLKAQHQQLQEEGKRIQTAARSHIPLDRSAEALLREERASHADTAQGANVCRILVAEDNPINRTQIVRLLEKLGYRADVAANGLDAVNACAGISYAAVLMDVQMPTMGGFEATARIRKQNVAEGVHTPIIAVTAHILPGDRERCLAAGMDDYLPKPVRPDALKAALARWLPLSA